MAFKRWTITAAVAALLLLSPTLISAAVEYDPDSAPTMELIFEAGDNYPVENLELNKCHNTFALADTSKYNAISAVEPDMGINFYMDDKCEEYDFSILSQVTEYQGAFASVKYTGQYKDAKTGFYENREFSETVLPDATGTPDAPTTTVPDKPAAPNPGNGGAGTGTGTGTKPAEGTSTALAGLAADGQTTTWTSPSAGLAVGMGIIGTVVVAGIVALGVFVYRRHGGKGKRGDGRAFMTLSTGRDDYDEETGLAGENGPHSSALMQSRVGVSFDDDRYPSKYRDEAEKSDDDDDDEVELGGYPQVPEGPIQYSHEPGTLPQNLRAP
ncbi:hypothetical protein BGZ97_002749 [Linnemannia gamsii]|uniref:Mid2 domain-containing protein n=1 Tax=Linnemannia gamsii TaxID=64522 RepID=A0A9P6QU68_9FUNG|nr:hypothetical protein BGZ97_002749 [Linnemannia gamsii]